MSPEEIQDAESPEETLLWAVPWALRLGRRLAARRGMYHCQDDLAGVAGCALVRALDGYTPSKGKFKPFAAAWIVGEVLGAIEIEAERMANEEPLDEDGGASVHPSTRAHELAGDVLEGLFDWYIAEDLRSNGEAALITSEGHAALHRELSRLPAEDQRLVKLRYFEGFTWKVVGTHLGIGERAAQVRDAGIRERLRDRLFAWAHVRPFRRAP